MYGPLYLRTRKNEMDAPGIGDELVVPGIPEHKMTFVGSIGPYGENVVDAPRGQIAHFIHLADYPKLSNILIGERGPADWLSQQQAQARAIEVVRARVRNRTFESNCEHIHNYIAKGKPSSPQLAGAVAIAISAVVFAALSLQAQR